MTQTADDMLFNAGVLTGERPGVVNPPEDVWAVKNKGFAVIECPQRIPCNPCGTSCPTGAITLFKDINDTPCVDYSKCTGCALCVSVCPGLACFVIDKTFGPDKALYKLPYEMLPMPKKGDEVDCLSRTGETVSKGKVEAITSPGGDRTYVVHVSAPKDLAGTIRAIRAAG